MEEIINITNNKFHAKENSIIRINTENAVLNITTKKLNIINNEFISKVGDATFISNPNGKTNIGSNVTEEINIDNNKLEGPNVYLFSGSHINTKVINITNNYFKATSGESCLAFEGVKFSENVEVLNIYKNTSESNTASHIIHAWGSINAKKIIIKENVMTPVVSLDGDARKYASVIYIKSGTRVTVNFKGENPYFEISGNKSTYDSDAIGITMVNDAHFSFSNNSVNPTTIVINNDIRSTGTKKSVINFTKKVTNPGNFDVKLEKNTIETNTLIIDNNVNLLLTTNSKLIGFGNSKIEILDDNILNIEFDMARSKIEYDKIYDLVYGFDNLKELIDTNRIRFNNGRDIELIIKGVPTSAKLELDESRNSIFFTMKRPNEFIDSDIRNDMEDDLILSEEFFEAIEAIIEQNYYSSNSNETVTKIAEVLNNDDYINTETPSNLIKDILSSETKDIIFETNSVIIETTSNVVSGRLNNSTIASSEETLLAAFDDYNSNYRYRRYNYNFEIWSKVFYNYNINFHNDKRIHTISITLGGEYAWMNDRYKIGLAYTFNNGNINEYIGHGISLYAKINDIVKQINGFVDIIFMYNRLNADINKNNSKVININHKYSADIISINFTFGSKFDISKVDILVPKIFIGYNYISRNSYKSILDIDIDKVSVGIFTTPSIGLDYERIINDNLSVIFSANFKNNIIINNNYDDNISYINGNKVYTINNKNVDEFDIELSLGLKYNPRNNIEISTYTYTSYSTNNYMNIGVGIEGKWK